MLPALPLVHLNSPLDQVPKLATILSRVFWLFTFFWYATGLRCSSVVLWPSLSVFWYLYLETMLNFPVTSAMSLRANSVTTAKRKSLRLYILIGWLMLEC